MLVLPYLNCRFDAIPIKALASYFVDFDELSVKFTGGSSRPGMARPILEKKSSVGELTRPQRTRRRVAGGRVNRQRGRGREQRAQKRTHINCQPTPERGAEDTRRSKDSVLKPGVHL